MPVNKKIIVFIIFCLVFLVGDVFYEVNFPKLNSITLKSAKIKNGEEVRIIQITDLHSQKFFNLTALFQTIKNSQPDFIVVTGDLIDKKTKDYSYVYGFVDELAKLNCPVYFVSGDHEQKNSQNILGELNRHGVEILNNKNIVFEKDGQIIHLYGLDYYNRPVDFDIFKDIPQEDYSILLVHNPYLVINNENIKMDLILSGDTHGGQIRLPLVGAIFVPGQPLFPKYSKGLYQLNNSSLLYIDSGLGYTLTPIRFFNRSQISLIKIGGQ
jgi:hypothetical protein